MLVLSRKQGQRIQISDNVTITVTQIKGNQVRLGVEAPRDVAIRRGELLAKTNVRSTQVDSGLVIDVDPNMLLSFDSAPVN